MTDISMESLEEKIDQQFRRQTVFVERLEAAQARLKNLWEEAKANDFERAEELCPQIVKLWEHFHKLSEGMDAGAYRLHTLQSLVGEALNINEGGKCPPWDPEC